MTRISIDNGGWFDRDVAQCWAEATYHDGADLISIVTGSQWTHEELFRSAGGTWIVHSWGAGRGDSYSRISPAGAAAWLIHCDHEIPEELSAVAAEAEV